jgi:hypothetical protein
MLQLYERCCNGTLSFLVGEEDMGRWRAGKHEGGLMAIGLERMATFSVIAQA